MGQLVRDRRAGLVAIAALVLACQQSPQEEPALVKAAPPASPIVEEAPAPAKVENPGDDHEAPAIKVLAPPRALLEREGGKVTARYEVTDASELGALTVNGEAIAGAKRGAGEAEVTVAHGLNLLTVEARDVHGNEGRAVQAIYGAKRFQPTTAGASATIPGAVHLWLGEQVLDGGEGGRDVATVAEHLMKKFGRTALVGMQFPFANAGVSGTATITAVDPGRADVTLGVKDGGLAVRAALRDLKISLRLAAEILKVDTTIDATVSARELAIGATLAIDLPAGGAPRVRTRDVAVTLAGLSVDAGRLGSAVTWLAERFEAQVKAELTRRLEREAARAVDGPLASALAGLAITRDVEVPGHHGARGVTLSIRSALESLKFVPARGAHPGGIEATLAASATSRPEGGRSIQGAIVRGDCRSDGARSRPGAMGPVELGVSLDLANQLLAALWQAGALDVSLDLSAELGAELSAYRLETLTVDARFSLPPTLDDCSGALELQVGDVALTLTTKIADTPTEISLYLSAAAPVRALAEAGAIALEVGEPRLFAVDVTAAKVGGAPASTAKIAFFQGALALARRRLFDTLRGTLTRYPLPSLDLSGLASDLPVDARLTPELRAVTTHGGRLQLGGRIR
ncbi:MAG: hypothetical protein R3A51_02630 [Nannocystaceae bacterium]|nr:hypothetical protein [Myxococcales bacterium]